MFCDLTIVGNVGRDPELRYTPSGEAVCNFSLAVNRSWTDRATNEKREETTWWKVAVFGNQAETVNQYVSKGSVVLVKASRIKSSAWVDPNDNTIRTALECTADRVRFISTKNQSGAGHEDDYEQDEPAPAASSSKPTRKRTAPPSDVDDIPF